MIDTKLAAERASIVFAEEGWEWYDGKPDVAQLEHAIEDLLDSVRKGEGHSDAETGRLIALKQNYEGFTDVKICLILGDEY